MRFIKGYLKLCVILAIICIPIMLISQGCDSKKVDKINQLVKAGNYTEAKAVLADAETDKSLAKSIAFILASENYYSSQEKYDDAAKVLVDYYNQKEDKSTLDDKIKKRLEDLKAKVSDDMKSAIENVEASILHANEEKSNKPATEKSKEKETKKQNDSLNKEISNALSKQDSDKIISLYNSIEDETKKKKFVEDVNNSYLKWLKKQEKSIRYTSESELQKISDKLLFVKSVGENDFIKLSTIKDAIDNMIPSEKSLQALRDKDKEVTKVDLDAITNLNVYIVNRVSSSTHISIAGIDITNKYTDQYQISSYNNSYGQSYPTDKWTGVMSFKKSRQVSQGIINIMAVKIKDDKFKDVNGFEKTLPVYIEVTQNDIDYTNACNSSAEIDTAQAKIISDILADVSEK